MVSTMWHIYIYIYIYICHMVDTIYIYIYISYISSEDNFKQVYIYIYICHMVDTIACCADIDECTEKSSGCAQKCANSPGSFQCSCSGGYTINSDGITCKQG